MSIHIQLPALDQIPEILLLSEKYLWKNLPKSQREQGFIRVGYSQKDFTRIIEAKEMVVAMDSQIVTGYL